MGMITLLVIGEVALRGLAGTSLIITDELSRYLMIWTAMLAATVLVYEDGHLRTTVLPDALSRRAARLVYFIADLNVLCFLGVVVGSSLALMRGRWRSRTRSRSASPCCGSTRPCRCARR